MITSLHSSHVETVKALLGSRGVKARKESGAFVIESLQNIKAVLDQAPETIKFLYYTQDGLAKLPSLSLSEDKLIEVTPEVMKAMTDTVTPQGLIAVAKVSQRNLENELSILSKSNRPARVAFFWQIQDPGNAGTVIRAADAFDFDLVIFSEQSVDVHSPKVVRSTAGSLWNVPVVEDVKLSEVLSLADKYNFKVFATIANAANQISQAVLDAKESNTLWIFGNEARGVPKQDFSNTKVIEVAIPISKRVESLNLATAASVVMYAASNLQNPSA